MKKSVFFSRKFNFFAHFRGENRVFFDKGFNQSNKANLRSSIESELVQKSLNFSVKKGFLAPLGQTPRPWSFWRPGAPARAYWARSQFQLEMRHFEVVENRPARQKSTDRSKT